MELRFPAMFTRSAMRPCSMKRLPPASGSMMSMSGVGRSTCPPETIAWLPSFHMRSPSNTSHSNDCEVRRVATWPASVQP